MTDGKKDTFGERLRKAREALGLTRADLAVLATVSNGTVKSIEFEREGAGKISAPQVLSAIAKKDLKLARWIAEAADAPLQAMEGVELGEAALVAPPPIGGRILIVRRGPRKEISIRLDWEATAQLMKYIAGQELKNPHAWGLAVTISVAVPDPPSRA